MNCVIDQGTKFHINNEKRERDNEEAGGSIVSDRVSPLSDGRTVTPIRISVNGGKGIGGNEGARWEGMRSWKWRYFCGRTNKVFQGALKFMIPERSWSCENITGSTHPLECNTYRIVINKESPLLARVRMTYPHKTHTSVHPSYQYARWERVRVEQRIRYSLCECVTTYRTPVEVFPLFLSYSPQFLFWTTDLGAIMVDARDPVTTTEH
ncbi:3505_t:CDS:2 [Acaulospora morrowiae]|uniref:3505_t:CDS:1 n=1 Tax=Acaulospora morrowiae TaxID=94023 RepID=A0A9N9NA74_9GLOM|nr:3505_t:CDS:2 [Acaulospora morrowiae]